MPPKVNALLFQNCLPHDIQLLKHRTLTCLKVEWKESSYMKKVPSASMGIVQARLIMKFAVPL